ncbi:MAG TPA: hypothetical protein EYP22_09575 [Methanosarcinales archaeon]|nr:hypothetical protein [Methanosarcinales archaeon]
MRCLYAEGYYPSALKKINDPPPLLYVRGKIPSNIENSIGVVGTRYPTEYGKRSAHEISKQIVEKDFVMSISS